MGGNSPRTRSILWRLGETPPGLCQNAATRGRQWAISPSRLGRRLRYALIPRSSVTGKRRVIETLVGFPVLLPMKDGAEWAGFERIIASTRS